MIASKSQFFNQCRSRQISHYVTANLNTHRIVCYRTDYYIVGMSRNFRIVFTIHHYKLSPFF